MTGQRIHSQIAFKILRGEYNVNTLNDNVSLLVYKGFKWFTAYKFIAIGYKY